MTEVAITGNGIPSIHDAYKNKDAFENIQRVAKLFSMSDLVPARYKGNVQNTVIALELSQRMNASALMVMQSLYVVHGTPSWSGQFVISAINSCGKFSQELDFEWSGTEGKDDWGCRCLSMDKKGKEKRGAKVTISMAKAEGWYDKSGSKWKTMAEQMLMYRAASFFGRVFCPEVLNGMYTVEEVTDYTQLSTASMDGYILKLLDSATITDEEKSIIEDKISSGLSEEEAHAIANELSKNQLDPVTQGKNYSLTEAAEAAAKK